ncbi:MAG: glycosyltransferase [Akkermansiaceae bacterium]
MDRLEVDGKFFRAGGERVFLKMVTYGPFPEDHTPDPAEEMPRIAQTGFNAIRIYGEVSEVLLGEAAACGLWVFIGPSWRWGHDFISQPKLYMEGERALLDGLAEWGAHPAVAGVFVANEIPCDMVRWMGVTEVRLALEKLITLGRERGSGLLFAYASFPTTEFLEPQNADFTAMNVYLEQRGQLAAYLPRLHHVAGDRPVLISEFGLDSRRGGDAKQAESLAWGIDECLRNSMAGVAIYSWCDRWWNAGQEVLDWDFGLTTRDGLAKPALAEVKGMLENIRTPEDGIPLLEWPMFSVIVCTYNGGHRMDACLRALERLDYPAYEVIVVDDGSTDDTVSVVEKYRDVRLIHSEHGGLSAARNLGARNAEGDIFAYTDDDCEVDAGWLRWLAWEFHRGSWDGCCGPNLPPLPEHREDVDEAVVAAAPGAPSHVMLDDRHAEHMPGCNLAVRREAFEVIKGFGEVYRVAGDDVDFCWRLDAAGFRMGFCGGAFVWHRRRTTLWRYLKQQRGYGKAEALLMRDHPEKFGRAGGARWKGRVYEGGALAVSSGDVIYHGYMGTAAYQPIILSMQPRRPLTVGFDTPMARFKLGLVEVIQPKIRAWTRWWYSLRWRHNVPETSHQPSILLADNWVNLNDYEARWWCGVGTLREEVLGELLEGRWVAIEDGSEWDIESGPIRAIIAREVHRDGVSFLVRVEMNAQSGGALPKDLEKVMEGFGMARV